LCILFPWLLLFVGQFASMKEAELAKDELARATVRRFAQLAKCQHHVLSVVSRLGVDALQTSVGRRFVIEAFFTSMF
jgi:hypothetical protein